jgi:flagellar motor switch protein FliG
MKPKLTPLTKAAIVLVSLDDEAADSMLAQMEPEQAGRIRRKMAELGDVDPDVQRQVVAEFCRGAPNGGDAGPRDPYPSGIELDSSLAEKLALPQTAILDATGALRSAEPTAFRFLHEAETDTLVEYLVHERPQTIALVISHLAPVQAADLLDRLAPTVQAQVLRRLAELDQADPAVLRELEQHLESWISEQLRFRQRRQAGRAALDAILSAAGQAKRRQFVANITRHDRSLAESMGFDVPRPAKNATASVSRAAPQSDRTRRRELRFADVINLDDRRLAELLGTAEAEVVVLSLAGATSDFVERVMSAMPDNKGRLLARALKHLGPTRLGDVEESQRALAELAANMFDATAGGSKVTKRAAVAA